MPLLHYREIYDSKLDQYAQDNVRNHVICIDGTGNDSPVDDDDTSTNVFRIFEAVADIDDQYSRYYAGVGSQEDDDNDVRQAVGKVTGAGAFRIVRTAYLDFVRGFRPGDRLFLFGFSRGAAMIRMLANRIAKHGIPERVVAKYYRQVFRNDLLVDIDCQGAQRDVDVTFMGVFDTVASFGIPGNQVNLFKDFTVAGNVRKVFHLMSIDEDRQPFEPTLMRPAPHIEEIWFPGVHSDTGGGYRIHNLSDYTLRFMVNRAGEHGLITEPLDNLDPDPTGPIHDHRASRMPKRQRRIAVQGGGEIPCIHESATSGEKRYMQADGLSPAPDLVPYEPAALRVLDDNYRIDPRD